MKKALLAIFTGVMALAPLTAWAGPLDGLFEDFPGAAVPKIMSCNIQGSIKRINTTTNQITYKVHISSTYEKMGTTFSVAGTVKRSTGIVQVYQLKGQTHVVTGENKFASLNGKTEQTFTFPIKDNPGVTLNATIDGVKCLPLYFKTLQVVSVNVPQTGVVPTLTLNGTVQTTSSVNLAPSQGQAGSSGSGSAVQPNGTVSREPQVNTDGLSGGSGSQSASGATSAGQNGAVGSGTVAPNAGGDGSGVVAGEVGGNAEGVVDGDGALENGIEENREAGWEDDGIQRIPSDKDEVESNEWSARDITMASLLGGILVALVALGIMKYKGMM